MVSKVRNVRLGVFSGGGCHHPKCGNLIRGPLRALKALKALKKAQIGVQIGGPLYEKTERDRGMKISGFVDLD